MLSWVVLKSMAMKLLGFNLQFINAKMGKNILQSTAESIVMELLFEWYWSDLLICLLEVCPSTV